EAGDVGRIGEVLADRAAQRAGAGAVDDADAGALAEHCPIEKRIEPGEPLAHVFADQIDLDRERGEAFAALKFGAASRRRAAAFVPGTMQAHGCGSWRSGAPHCPELLHRNVESYRST